MDFDHRLDAAVNQLREALGDSASSPRYVETLAPGIASLRPRKPLRLAVGPKGSSWNPPAAQLHPELVSPFCDAR
ncbi:MAG: hypothetical protein ABSF15_03935 [Candidatus Sulfotelmatobacter sp.]